MPLSLVQPPVSVQNTSSAASITATFPSGIAAGSIIVALITNENLSSAITLTDGSSDTPTFAFVSPLQDFSVVQGTIAAFFSPTAGTTTVTAAFSPDANQQFLTIYEVGGYTAGTASWDGTSSNRNGAGTSPLTSGTTATLAQATEAAFGLAWNNSTTSTPVAPWVADNQATSWNVVAAHQLVSSATALAFTATFSGTIQYGALVATIKGTLAGGDTLGLPMQMLMMSRRRRDPVKTLLLPSRYARRTRGFALAA